LKKGISLILILTMLSLMLNGCGNGSTKETTEQNQTGTEATEAATNETAAPTGDEESVLRIGGSYSNDIFSAWSQRSAYGQANYHSFSQLNLWRVDENLELTGDGCFFNSWDVAEDNLSLVLHFDPLGELMWHDGQPVTIDDVIFTFNHYKDNNIATFQNIENVEIESDTSIRLTFKEPTAFGFMHSTTLSSYLLPKHVWENVEDPRTYDGEDAVIGCGPFKFVSVDSAAQISYYEAVKDYPIGDITIDKVELKSYADQSAIIMAMMNDEVDVMYTYSAPLDHTLLSVIEAQPDIDQGGSTDPSTFQLIFGFGTNPTDDYNFRKGLSYAFDYELIAQAISGGYGEMATTGAASPSQKGYDPNYPLNEYNVDEANKYLDEGGFIDTDGDGFRELPDGSEMIIEVFRHYYPPELVPIYERIAEIMRVNLEKVGVQMTLDEQAWSDNQEYILDTMRNNRYQLMLITTPLSMVTWGGITNYVADLEEISGRFFGSYQDSEYLEAYKKMLYSTNYQDYEDGYRDVQRMNSEDVTALVWEITTSHYPYRIDKFTGWINYPGVGTVNGDLWYNLKPIAK